MKKMFAVLFAWTLFSTQVFAQTPSIASMDVDDSNYHRTVLESFTEDNFKVSIDLLRQATWEDVRFELLSLGVEEDQLLKMTEDGWVHKKGEIIDMLGQEPSQISEEELKQYRDEIFATLEQAAQITSSDENPRAMTESSVTAAKIMFVAILAVSGIVTYGTILLAFSGAAAGGKLLMGMLWVGILVGAVGFLKDFWHMIKFKEIPPGYEINDEDARRRTLKYPHLH